MCIFRFWWSDGTGAAGLQELSSTSAAYNMHHCISLASCTSLIVLNPGLHQHSAMCMQGAVPGCKKRLITLRRSMFTPTSRTALEAISLKFIDTASKIGHGRFQLSSEKARTLGRLKEPVAV